MSLLEQAKQIKIKNKSKTKIFTDEDLELILGWLKEEVSYLQVVGVINLRTMALYCYLARGLKEAYKKGLIK